jgi:uncharacterized membrane protein (Fun14 family)
MPSGRWLVVIFLLHTIGQTPVGILFLQKLASESIDRYQSIGSFIKKVVTIVPFVTTMQNHF